MGVKSTCAWYFIYSRGLRPHILQRATTVPCCNSACQRLGRTNTATPPRPTGVCLPLSTTFPVATATPLGRPALLCIPGKEPAASPHTLRQRDGLYLTCGENWSHWGEEQAFSFRRVINGEQNRCPRDPARPWDKRKKSWSCPSRAHCLPGKAGNQRAQAQWELDQWGRWWEWPSARSSSKPFPQINSCNRPATSWGRCRCYLHFTDEKAEAQGRQEACPRSHSWKAAEPEAGPKGNPQLHHTRGRKGPLTVISAGGDEAADGSKTGQGP